MGLFVSLPALLGISLGIRRYTRMPFGAAPLAGLGCIYTVLFLGGICGVLPLTGWILVAAGWLLLLLEVVRYAARNGKAERKDLITPGSILFWGGAILLALRLAYLQPAFLNFDEYSFWGAASRLTCETGHLYPACETGRPWVMTELPGIPLMGYFFQQVGTFTHWQTIFAVDLLLLAPIAAVVACCEKKSARLWGPATLAAVLIPTAMTIPGRTGLVNTTWLEILGDMPAGMLFGGAVAFWLAVRDTGKRSRWFVMPVLFLAAGIKSNTLVLALTAAGLIFLDVVLEPNLSQQSGIRSLMRRVGFGLLGLFVPLAEYVGWTRYTVLFVLANASAGGMGDTANATLPEIVINGIKMLLGGTGTEFFEARRADLFAYANVMGQAFTQRSVSIFGNGAAVCIGIGLIFILAFCIARGCREKMRVAATAVGSTLCFGGYWLMLLLSYTFLLKDSSPSLMGLASYPRYMCSYYAGWLLLALAVLVYQAAQNDRLLGLAGVLAVAVLICGVSLWAWKPQFTILGASPYVYSEENARRAQAEKIKEELAPDDRLFLIRQEDDGFYWFWYAEALLPNIVEYGTGGGTFGAPEYAAENRYYQSYTPQELVDLIQESGASHVLCVKTDDTFIQSYAALFSDELVSTQNGAALYEIRPDGYALSWAEHAKEGTA